MVPKSLILVSMLLHFPSLNLAKHSVHKINQYLSDEYIDRINAEQSLWRAGRNFDPTTSTERLKYLFGELDPEKLDAIDTPAVKTEDLVWPKAEDIPEHFDARSKWSKICPRIKEIQDQGHCGSCWAVSASSAITDRHCISSVGKFKGRLSAQHVSFCCSQCTDGHNGCLGGYTSLAWSFFNKRGIVSGGSYNSTEGCQPYTLQPCVHYGDSSAYPMCNKLPVEEPKCQHKCYNKEYQTPFKRDKKKSKNSYVLSDAESIQKDIMAYGPLTLSFSVYKDFLNYKSGVYNRTTDEFAGRHAVRAIGWGKENGVPYWLIANSWNQYWGDNGLFKIIRGSNHCSIEDNANGGVP